MALSRRTAITTLLAGGLVAMTGCSGSGGSSSSAGSSGPVDITFSYLWSGAEAKPLEDTIAKFNASQGRIRVKGISSPDMQKQLTSMSSKNGSFDVSDNFGNVVGSWAAKGVIAPLDDELAKHGGTEDFVPAAMEQMRYDGKVYSVPIAVHTYQLLYNEDLLKSAGVAPPKTLAELTTAVEKLTKVDGAGNITQLGLGDPNTVTTLTTLAYAMGGDWQKIEGNKSTATPANPANVEAAQWYQDTIIKKYGADKVAKFKAGYGQYMSAQDPFYTGKVAMIIDGAWHSSNIAKVAPKLKWNVTAVPAKDASLAGATQLTASTLFIPSNSKHKAEAAEFLAYLAGKDGMRSFTAATGNLPARRSLAGDPAYADLQHLDVWLKSLTSDKLKAMPSAPYGAQYTTDLGSAFDQVISGKTDAQTALQKVGEKAKSYDQ